MDRGGYRNRGGDRPPLPRFALLPRPLRGRGQCGAISSGKPCTGCTEPVRAGVGYGKLQICQVRFSPGLSPMQWTAVDIATGEGTGGGGVFPPHEVLPSPVPEPPYRPHPRRLYSIPEERRTAQRCKKEGICPCPFR
ncbi:protein of unknown function [Methanoculleus bourgensis]|uniref:Uncharacterized protein n=1 Tax=Methanoculleus bourgensis TaxID=83986 RepID=A0A0X3BIC7_9EURY|nr:protein of unknown function [Methanoculleus bourgensis]